MSEETTLDDFADLHQESKNNREKKEARKVRLGPQEFKIPVDWSVTELGKLGKIVTGDTPSTDNEEYFGDEYPFVTPEDLRGDNEVDYIRRGLTEKGLDKTRPIPEGSVMMDCIGSDMGKVALAKRKLATNQQINSVVPDNSIINSIYLLYQLQGISDIIRAQAGSTATPILNKSRFSASEILLAPFDEQRKIASVLYNIDKAIQTTDEIIDQLKLVRQGTEQDLLSKGVLEDGSPRPESEIEYKSSWVGEVPKDWEVQQYSELISDSSVGIVVKPSQYYDSSGTVPILRSKDITQDGIERGDFKYMTEESNRENSNSILHEGDVITVRSGDPGLSCVVSSEFDGANCADLLISTPGPNLDPHYAALWINSYAGRKQIDRYQAGLAQKHFNLGALRKLKVAVPRLEEQQRIVNIISSISESIDREEQYKTLLQRLKQGLMQELLWGSVRTKDTNIEVLPEVEQYG